jgi:ribose transport system ATP-binding protein
MSEPQGTERQDEKELVAQRVALRIVGAKRSFGATHAVDGVDLEIHRGSINALLGANGSGKSSLVKLIAGVYQADEGHIEAGAESGPLSRWTPAQAAAAGMRFVHQDLGLFPSLSVADNLALGVEFPTRLGAIQKGELQRRADAVLARMNLAVSSRALLGDLTPGQQAIVAIGRALQDDLEREAENASRILVLDEPTAALGHDEATMLMDVLRRLAAAGETIVFIGHRLAEVFSIATRIIVMRDGRVVLDRQNEATSKAEVIDAMIVGQPGRSGAPTSHADDEKLGTPPTPPFVSASGVPALLECKNLARGPLRDVSLELPAGSIVGIAGLLGTGRSMLLRTIFGDLAPEAGSVLINGSVHRFKNPGQAIRRGLALIPADRGRDGVFPDLDVRENMLVGDWPTYRAKVGMSARDQAAATRRGIDDLRIRTSGPQAGISQLSGGNQQKVVVARALLRGARIFLMDEPTQGVDVVARKELWATVRSEVDAGAAALVVSSDFEELVEVCDEILVLREGVIAERFTRGEVNEEVLNKICQGA